MASDDTEITLGVGKLLGLFFLLAAICGVFFSIGYSLGKSSGREQALNDQAVQTGASAGSASAGSASSDGKPSAAVVARAPADDSSAAAAQNSNLTFYKAVQQSDSRPQTAAANSAQTAAAAPTAEAANGSAATSGAPGKSATNTHTAADVISHTSPVTGPGTIVVQIAALSREDDAVALAGALRKKNYNVFVVNNPVTNDRLYHVQVGPFSTLTDAEAMKARLVAEGYNPIIKK
ncbi:MAG TPA: SPOR domain-containing protein [Candidatus Binatia bacterium]|nr:SPOR domain-containing protein [Candidatus Binatia bacterium]